MATTDHAWVTTGKSFPCHECGGACEMLEVVPRRSRFYLNVILMCNRCKRILI